MSKRVIIEVSNSTSRILSDLKVRIKLRKELAIKSPGYFWSPSYREGRWDGYIRYVTEAGGLFSTGLLDQVIDLLEKWKYKVEVVDKRSSFKPVRNVKKLGDKVLRGDQLEAVQLFMDHKVGGIPFRRGIMAEATNTGKSLICAGIIKSFSNKRYAIFLVDSKDLFEQAVKDLEEFFPDEVGFVASHKGDKFNRINVCMVQTIGARFKKDPKYKAMIAKCSIVVVDEGDKVIGRKDTQQILTAAYQAPVRVCLSGSPLTHKGNLKQRNLPHGGSIKNQEQLKFFGPIIHRRTNKQNVDDGISTKPIFEIYQGNTKLGLKSYEEQLEKGIIKNKDRHKQIWNVVKSLAKRKKIPLVILFRYKKHATRILKACPEKILDRYKIKIVHGETPNRPKVLEDFKEGKIDILIASKILERGLNLPNMHSLINAMGGQTEAVILQILGRLLRNHHSKDYVIMADFMDEGKHLSRHSRFRIKVYKKEKFEVKTLY